MSTTETARQINHSDSVDGREVAFKAMISGFARGMEEHLVDTPVTGPSMSVPRTAKLRFR